MKEEALKSHADAVLAVDGALYDAGFEDGKASVVVPTDGGQYTKEQVDKLIAGAIAALPADGTPYSEEQMTAVKAELQAAKDVVGSKDEQIAALQASMAKIDAILHPVVVAPVDPAPAA